MKKRGFFAPAVGTIPSWLLRQLRRRDCGRCRFPGCRNRVRLQAHHIRWWEWGGRTDLDNLCLVCHLCRRRHNEHYADSAFMPSWAVPRVGTGA